MFLSEEEKKKTQPWWFIPAGTELGNSEHAALGKKNRNTLNANPQDSTSTVAPGNVFPVISFLL